MKSLWIVGAGGHGAVVADAAAASGRWQGLEFFDDGWPGRNQARGWTVAGDIASLRRRLATGEGDVAELVIALGDNARRLMLNRELSAAGAHLATVIHPFSAVSGSAVLGAGTVVLAGAVLNAGVRLGSACIVNTRASIDHDCVIGESVHVCPGVTLAGNVTVQDLAWLGVGSCAIQGVTIGRSAVVGAGAVVIADVKEGTTVVGCPAKETRRVI